MATKKVETLYVVMDFDGCCFVDFDGDQISDVEEVVFDKEDKAIEAAKGSFETQSWDETETLTVYKLVPIARVKKAKATVEKV